MILLASGSPRRAELLTGLGVHFVQQSVDLGETRLPGEDPQDYVQRLALEKARAGWQRFSRQTGARAALGSDTAVVLDEDILGKPLDQADHERMLARLSGRSHWVVSAVALVNEAQSRLRVSSTQVWMRPISLQEIARYWASDEPQDKAGGYAIQGLGGVFVERIEGSYSSVVGLPVLETAQLLDEFAEPYWLAADGKQG